MGYPGAPGGVRHAGRRGGEDSLKHNSWRNGLSRFAVLGALTLSAASVVAACGGGGDNGGSSSGGSSSKKVDMAAELKKPASITVWAWTPGTEKAIAMFEKAYPNIK